MKTFTLILTLILFPAVLFCQEPPKAAESSGDEPPTADGTTIEEWLYATKGYEDDVSKGKDPAKEGYTFEKTHTFVTRTFAVKEGKGDPTYTIDFVEMKKAGKLKVTIVKIARGSSLITYAFPTPDCAPEVNKAYIETLAKMAPHRAKLVLVAYHDYLSALRSGKPAPASDEGLQRSM